MNGRATKTVKAHLVDTHVGLAAFVFMLCYIILWEGFLCLNWIKEKVLPNIQKVL